MRLLSTLLALLLALTATAAFATSGTDTLLGALAGLIVAAVIGFAGKLTPLHLRRALWGSD